MPNTQQEAAASASTQEIEFFLVLGPNYLNGAVQRLTSSQIGSGLVSLARKWTVLIANDTAALTTPTGICVLFHSYDKQAVRFLRATKSRISDLIVGCFYSDIYNFEDYIALDDLVNFYIAPTDLHRRILTGQLYKPVYVVEEGIDPIATGVDIHNLNVGQSQPAFPVKNQKRSLWFGYAESFSKGMSSIMPVVRQSVESGHLEKFSIITDADKFTRSFGAKFDVPMIPYADNTFRSTALTFDYSILSHIPLDLHVNSIIKSSNKAVTSLFCGLIPLCSNTPSYGELLESYGLQRFLFTSPSDLANLIRRLDPVADSAAIQESAILSSLATKLSPSRRAREFLTAIEDYSANYSKNRFSFPPPSQMVKEYSSPSEISLRQHLIDLFPSALRSLKKRSPSLKKGS